MDIMLITITLALLGLSGLCWATKPELIIEPVGVIKQGDRVTIKCRIPAEGPFDIAKIVRKLWNDEYTLSKKGNVELFYRRTGRYMVTHFDPRAGEVDLTIREVIGADSGVISCIHVNTAESASENLIIHVPPKKVELLYFSGGETKLIAEEGQVISLEPNGGFECRVWIEGSEHKPEVKVMVGDIDISDECTVTPDLMRVNHDGLVEFNNVITYTYSRRNHDIDFNGKTLSCQVTMPEYDMVEATAVIEVLHPPVLSCGTVRQKLGARNVQLKCLGTMNPPPTFSLWVWGRRRDMTMLHTGRQIPGFQADVEQTGNGRYTFTLTIDVVTMDRFTRYKLEVENDIGMTDQMLRLVREEETITEAPVAEALRQEEEIVTYAPEPTQQPTTKPNPDKGARTVVGDTGVASTSRTASIWTLVMSVATIIGATMFSLS